MCNEIIRMLNLLPDPNSEFRINFISLGPTMKDCSAKRLENFLLKMLVSFEDLIFLIIFLVKICTINVNK